MKAGTLARIPNYKITRTDDLLLGKRVWTRARPTLRMR